jgi:Condensation domain
MGVSPKPFERYQPRPPILAGQQLPLSIAQETMLFWDRLVPHSAVYNVPLVLRISGPLDIEALRRTIALIVSRHEVLRSNFLFIAGEPAQVAGPTDRVDFLLVDLSRLPAEDKSAALKDAAQDEVRRPFDLARDAMLRVRVFRGDVDEHVVVLTMHHIASDGWSVGVLVNELAEGYAAFSTGVEPNLPPLRIQYADWATWQRELLRGPALESLLAFWKQQLGGMPEFSDLIPLSQPRPAKQSFEGGVVRTVLPDSFSASMAQVGQMRRATVFMVMLGGFQALLHRYSGREDIAIGAPVANRARPELTALIGCFINMVVVRGIISGNPTFLEFLGRLRETALAAFFHPELPFSELVRHLRPKRSANHTPYFQVQLVFQNYPMPVIRWPGLTVSRIDDLDTATSKFDISVFIEQQENKGLEIAFEYNASLFEHSAMEKVLADYRLVLESVVKNPETRLRDLPVSAMS